MRARPRPELRGLLLLLAVLATATRPAGAQTGPDSSVARVVSDSAARVRALADSILLEDDPEDDALLEPPGARQFLSLQSMNRSYAIGSGSYSENVGLLSYRLSVSSFRLSVNASPLRYNAGATSIAGAPPVSVRLDWLPGPGDTLRVFGRSQSSPATLDSAQSLAIGAVGVSTIELESFSLGTPAMVGARGAFSFPDGDLVFGVRAAIEYQPRPSGSNNSYWTGTTISGGLSLAMPTGDLRTTALLDVASSYADSLGGRNLFQGGGNMSVELRVDGLLGGEAGIDAMFSAWFQKPFGNTRSDQPNRLIPVGDTYGLYGTLTVPVGSMLLTPTVALARESASDDAASGRSRFNYAASSWAVNGGLALSLPLGGSIDLTPEIGFARGSADGSFVATTIIGGAMPGRPGRPVTATQNFRNRISGWWVAMELSVRF